MYRLFGIGLAFAVDGGVDFITRVNRMLAELFNQFAADHFTDIGKSVAYPAVRHIKINWFRNAFFILTLIDIA
ncbi:hypothetical protein D3C71_1331830 [compost metagenome]